VHAFEILGDPVRRRIVELLGDGEQRVLRENGFATVRAASARDEHPRTPPDRKGGRT
jgi:hypothetical protein